MRRLILAAALSILPVSSAVAEEEAVETAPAEALPASLPEQVTPEALESIAQRLDQLSRIHLIRTPGGRKTAEQRRTLSANTSELSKRLSKAASELELAQAQEAAYNQQLQIAEAGAVATVLDVASSVKDLNIRQELFDLLEQPAEAAPEPKTYVFCMEASGAGPRTFERYATEALTQSIPYVQGYIAHKLQQTAPSKLRLVLTAEHDAGSAPFAAIDALHAANKAAVDAMEDSSLRPAETILTGEFAERLCAPTPPRGQ